MENKILIPLAIFCLSILIAQNFYTTPNAIAQLSFTVTALSSYTGNINEQSGCEYINSSEVWCTSQSGIKIINPTTRTITNTLYSGLDIDDIECSGSLCYSWHNGDSASANLTGWTISGKNVFNSTLSTMTGGANLGRDIDLLSATGSVTIAFPSSSTSCIGSGGTSLKGVCIMAGDTFQKTRFISSGDTGASAIVFGIKSAETTGVFQANFLVLFQDGAGTRTLRILNIADPDTTFTNTQICTPTSATGFGVTEFIEMFVYDDTFYLPFDNGSTGLYLSLAIDASSCATTSRFITTFDVPTSLSTDGEFFYISSYDGSTLRSSVQVFNLTGSSSIATYNITGSVGERAFNGWYHTNEGELQILRGSNLVVFQVQAPSGGNDAFCELPENANILTCRLEDTPPLTGTSVLFNQSATNIVCQIGLLSCTQDDDGNFVPDNPDIQTNGVGYLILAIALGVMISIFWVASAGRLVDIPTFIWMLGTIAIVGGLTAFEFIDPTLLIVSIIIVVALATAKAKGVFSDAQLFSGES